MKSIFQYLLPVTALCVLLAVLAGCKPEELGAAHPTTNEFYDPPGTLVFEPRLPLAPKTQDVDAVKAKSAGCLNCHKGIENPSMHASPAVKLGCTDCHGGNAACDIKELAHVQPRGHWYSQTPSTTPVRKRLPGQPPLEEKKDAVKTEGPSSRSLNNNKVGNAGPGSPKEQAAAALDYFSSDVPRAEIVPLDGKGDVQPINTTARLAEPAVETKDKDAPAKTPVATDPVLEAPVEGEIMYGHGEGHHGAANPRRAGAAWLMESPEFVRFVNPGDLRVAKYACGECHKEQTNNVNHSMMAHGAMLWNAALYNNGASNQKVARFGEAYTFDGQPARLRTLPVPTPEETRTRGILPFLDPLPRYNISQPGNILRAFERGGRSKPETALTNKDSDAGKPEMKLSVRGIGTELSTDPVFLGLQKTRLLDPTLWELGTNDQAGDYRSSGCTACHVIYANDRDPKHSGPWAKYGKDGQSFTKDAALRSIIGKENGHPVQHVLTKSVPSSQCIVCHMHPGTTVTMTYFGNLWWDNETEGSKMYPATQEKKTERDMYKIKVRNPDGGALRGKWGDVDFLESVADHNDEFKQQQFADYNGHGWLYRNVYKRDKKGNLLDKDNKIVPPDSPNVFKKSETGEPVAGSAVHMQDIHQEKGMHCVDCHFSQDNHGNGKLYGEVRNATEITCQDCHGSIREAARLRTSGNAAPDKSKDNKEGGTDIENSKTAFGPRFSREGGRIIQQSAIDKDLHWEVKQVVDTITPGHPNYNEKSRLAKTMRRDGKSWGDVPDDKTALAHNDDRMDCYVCHTSWVASCFGCHLPMRANQARENNHFEGAKSRNWTQYNFQTLREDVFMLGLDGTVKKNKIAPVRSTCAVLVGSQNANREWIYSQQQTVSAEGFSGHAFSPHFPHAVRAKETKNCTDCHLSQAGDNNAQMAQLLMQGTNQTNFMFRFVYTAAGSGGLNATVVTEQAEPQAVIGSTLHRDAYPEEFEKHLKHNRELEEGDHHAGTVLGVQLRGEYLYAARGKGGLTIYDVANVDNKGFSEKITTAPVSPLGQRFYVKSKNCTAVVSPTVLAVDPSRQPPLRPRDPNNEEQPISLTYAFLYCTDSEEGLFTVLAGTLLDGDPTNNYLTRHMTFNPGGILNGAVNATVAGNYIYVCCDAGLVIVDISGIGSELVDAAKRLNPDGTKVISVDELQKAACKADPNTLKVVGIVPMNHPKAVRIQFRYAFAVDCDGLKVVDITEPENAKLVEGAFVPFREANNVYLSRTYAYVAAGHDGIGIVDIEKAGQPRLDQMFNAGGQLCDIRDVKIGMTNTSVFAYAADAGGQLAVIQLTSPETNPNNLGWTPRPNPVLIATKKLPGTPMAISEGVQRDRGVDESGNQLSVFNRVGSRPFNKAEAEKLYKIDGKVFMVSNEPPGPGTEPKLKAGQIPPELQKKIDDKKAEVQDARGAQRVKLKAELDELLKQAEAIKSAGAGGNEARIKELEEQIKEERNPAVRNKLKQELEELKSGKKPEPVKPPEPPPEKALTPEQLQEQIDALKEKIRFEKNPAARKIEEQDLERLLQQLKK